MTRVLCRVLARGRSLVVCARRYALVLAHAGQIINAAVGPFIVSTPQARARARCSRAARPAYNTHPPQLLSAQWFAVHERTTSTGARAAWGEAPARVHAERQNRNLILSAGIAAMASYLGCTVGFLVALPVVGERCPLTERRQTCVAIALADTRDVLTMLRLEAAVAIGLLLVCLLDVRLGAALPRVPPTVSAAAGGSGAPRDGVRHAPLVRVSCIWHASSMLRQHPRPADRDVLNWPAVLTVLRNRDFMFLAAAFGVSLGTYASANGC